MLQLAIFAGFLKLADLAAERPESASVFRKSWVLFRVHGQSSVEFSIWFFVVLFNF